jgi:hypothetical protein
MYYADRNFIVSPLAAANLASVRPADVFSPTIAVALAD